MQDDAKELGASERRVGPPALAAFCSLMKADLRAGPAADSLVRGVAVAAVEDLQLHQKPESEVRH